MNTKSTTFRLLSFRKFVAFSLFGLLLCVFLTPVFAYNLGSLANFAGDLYEIKDFQGYTAKAGIEDYASLIHSASLRIKDNLGQNPLKHSIPKIQSALDRAVIRNNKNDVDAASYAENAILELQKLDLDEYMILEVGPDNHAMYLLIK